MTPEKTKLADKMKTTKAVIDKAPTDPKKDTAHKHYNATENAHTAKKHDEATKELDAAHRALA